MDLLADDCIRMQTVIIWFVNVPVLKQIANLTEDTEDIGRVYVKTCLYTLIALECSKFCFDSFRVFKVLL